ncbi:alpha/beta hydrolase family protein [Abyssisolibacter fermentans]|uniref:alpha/beta hydrolase family protein n=1 Tax=Abyssisolibacter fermentans TaxID=1766203 RepID=UPI0008372954|nr:S9 family peptidase [Abyssisolibacter fermentans]
MTNIKLDDLVKYKFLSKVKFSPNGEYACFVVHDSNLENNNYQSYLWLYKIKDKKYYQLTTFGKESDFIWSFDSNQIIFSSLRDKDDEKKQEEGENFTQFYTINIHGGEAKKAFSIPKNVDEIALIDEESYIFSSSMNVNQKELYHLDEESKKKELKQRKEDKDYEILDEIPYWGNGLGYTNKIRTGLYLYNVNTKRIQQLSDKYMNVEYFELNKDKDKVIFIAEEFKDKMRFINKIYLYDINSSKLEEIPAHDDFSYNYVGFFNKNELICNGSDMKAYGLNENGKFYLIDINTNKADCITPDFDYSLWNSVNSDCRFGNSVELKVINEELYFIVTKRDSSYLNKLDRNGNITTLTKLNGSIDNYDVYNDKILFIGLRGLKLQELYELNGDDEKPITNFNGWVQSEKTVASIEKLVVETDEGVLIDGWVMKPVDFKVDKKYPAILDIHGGPKTAYGEVFVHEMQYWANSGYFVFFCNPRGSDGRGNEFADIRGKYGTIDYDDLSKFTDAVLEKYPQIDKDRVGVTGGSYGGFMTNWIIGHTDRFKAAASQRSISNWISFFNTSDIGYLFGYDQCLDEPWNNYEKLWQHSPLKYANNVKTPTLFIHSEEDYRCWLAEGMQMYTAVKYHGVDTRMCIFRGENHELSRSGKPKHRIKRLQEITDWFDEYLK